MPEAMPTALSACRTAASPSTHRRTHCKMRITMRSMKLPPCRSTRLRPTTSHARKPPSKRIDLASSALRPLKPEASHDGGDLHRDGRSMPGMAHVPPEALTSPRIRGRIERDDEALPRHVARVAPPRICTRHAGEQTQRLGRIERRRILRQVLAEQV